MKKTLLLVSLLALLSGCLAGAQTAFKPFKHYNEMMEKFRHQPPIDSTSIVMLGNSLTEFGGDWNKHLDARHVVNRGIAGDVAMGIYNRLTPILSRHPKAIFLMCGTNDVSHNLTPAQVAQLVEKVIEKIRTDAPDTKLYVQSLLPFNEGFGNWKLLEGKTDDIPEINRLLRAYCEAHAIPFIDLFPKFVRHGTNELRRELSSDGLHLSPIGYKVWAFVLKKYVKELQN